ncbi:SET domain-containing protein [Sporobolomyces salmoneus]|uniref:SET domain-containing protein n=1 Tax=Sporobolomyces salmoneus TaxID=183962 RepID=UPI00317FCCC3
MSLFSNAQASVAFLSGADDLLSRLLLDYSIFAEPRVEGRATGKINKHVRELRMTDKEVENARTLVSGLRSGSISLTKGLETLLEFPSVDSFVQKWDDDDLPLFSNHAKRYILAFRPDCGIAFHETDRYKNPRSGVTARAKKNIAAVTSRRDPASFIEVGVFATRDFKKGEVINLRGGIADLTEDEDDEMRLSGGRSDFSVLWSERKNCFCLLLGPARFVNHDCRNNVEFNLVGTNMTFKVVEDIKKDEELFTHYGAHYFETDNAACLCATCEQLKQGAFTPTNKRQIVEPETPEPASPVVSRARRNSSPGPGPSRSSSRASRLPPVNYDENAPVASTSASAVLAQRAVPSSTSRTRSSSVGSSKIRPRPPSSRTMPVRGALSVVDALRGKPRLIVQPKLAPPPGYSNHYVWDNRTRIAKYTGPQVCKDDEERQRKAKAKPTPLKLTRSNSIVSLSKRRRLDTDSPKSKPAPPPRIRPTSANRLKKKPRIGERRSGRLSVGNVPIKPATKVQKVKAQAKREESSSLSEVTETEDSEELSELESSEGEESREEDVEEEAEVTIRKDKGKGKAVEESTEDDDEEEEEDVEMGESASPQPFALPPRTRNGRNLRTYGRSGSRTRSISNEAPVSSVSGNAHLRTVTLDLGFSTSTPVEEDPTPLALNHGSDEEADSEKPKLSKKPSPFPADDDDDDPRLPPDRPRRSISSPNFYSNSKYNQRATEGGGGGGASNSNSNGTSNGESSFCEAPSSAGSSGRGSYSQRAATNNRAPNGGHNGRGLGSGSGSGSGSGGDEEDERNGRKRGIPTDKMDVDEEEEEEDKKPDIREEGSEGESVGPSSAQCPEPRSNIRRGKRPIQRNDDGEEEGGGSSSQAAASPKAKKTRIESPASSEEPAPRARKNIRWGKGKPGVRPPTIPPPPPPPVVRPPVIESPSPQPESEPEQPTRTEPRNMSRRASAPTASRPRISQPPPVVNTGRQTRSKPIPGRLEDVLSAPETLAATGGYDWEKGKYITRHEQLRAPSSNPRPSENRPSESPPSPPPSPQRRRRRKSSSIAPAPPPRPAIASPAASTSSLPAPAKKPRRSNSPVVSKSTARRRVTHSPVASTSRVSLPSPAVSSTTAVPPDGRRATRRSFPIAGGLKDVIYSSSALAATGGWDEESGRYVGASSHPVADDSASSSNSTPGPRKPSSSSIKRSKSATPRSASSSSSAPAPPKPQTSGTPNSATRSTRRSNPINQRLEQLVYSSAVGGWDPEKGKYVSQVAARKAKKSEGSVEL